jgi:cyanophycin synthetase
VREVAMNPAASRRPFPPFEDSRRLLGPNLHFAEVGAVLETLGPVPDAGLVDAWRTRVRAACGSLGWPEPAFDARRHAGGIALAFSAPLDRLFCATEINEWAWLATLHDIEPAPEAPRFHAPGHPAAWDDAAAHATLRRLDAGERAPRTLALAQAAHTHGLRLLLDDEALSIGGGDGARCWPLDSLPAPDAIDWPALHDVPVALVTGSNGKTTTVRLVAAMLRAHGLRSAWNCTDGVFVDGEPILLGDYSGPAGARAVLRAAGVEAAVIEAARGGLLRRGLALDRADVAVVTNISIDHFGEYGIHDLDGLADAKLIVARALRTPRATLVLNADDPVLRRRAPRDGTRLAWFALDDAAPALVAHRADGGATCGIDAGRLRLHHDGGTHDLGAIAAMPLAFGGHARYNLANLAAASLAAATLGVAPGTISRVLASFGAARGDNPGRLQYGELDGVHVFVDYAHNVEGLRGLLAVARARLAPPARLGVLLGQAGNRGDVEIRGLAAEVAAAAPARIVVKELAGMLRGRRPGEVPDLLQAALLAAGVPAATIARHSDERSGAQALLGWARPGDVVVLPLHEPAVRDEIVARLPR